MTEYVYRVTREHESRTVESDYAADLETAKELARNMVVLETPAEWVEDGHWSWVLEGYGDYDEGCYINKHILKGENDES